MANPSAMISATTAAAVRGETLRSSAFLLAEGFASGRTIGSVIDAFGREFCLR